MGKDVKCRYCSSSSAREYHERDSSRYGHTQVLRTCVARPIKHPVSWKWDFFFLFFLFLPTYVFFASFCFKLLRLFHTGAQRWEGLKGQQRRADSSFCFHDDLCNLKKNLDVNNCAIYFICEVRFCCCCCCCCSFIMGGHRAARMCPCPREIERPRWTAQNSILHSFNGWENLVRSVRRRWERDPVFISVFINVNKLPSSEKTKEREIGDSHDPQCWPIEI